MKLGFGVWLAAVPVKTRPAAAAPVPNTGLMLLNKLKTSPMASTCTLPGSLKTLLTRRLNCCCAAPRPQLIVVQAPISS